MQLLYLRKAIVLSAAACVTSLLAVNTPYADTDKPAHRPETRTPIKHLIVSHAASRRLTMCSPPTCRKATIWSSTFLSEGIVRPDGSPGGQFARCQAIHDRRDVELFHRVGPQQKTAYQTLPPPTLNGAPNKTSASSPPFNLRRRSWRPSSPFGACRSGSAHDPRDGRPGTTGPDFRIANDLSLPYGSFQLTGKSLPYTSIPATRRTASTRCGTVHCSPHSITYDNTSGCLNDLYPFVITTYAGPTADKGGGTSIAFYNVQDGDAPLLKRLADEYTMSDNYHQPAQGGTGIQHVFMGTGDDVYWSHGEGHPAVPPSGIIANPNPQTGFQQRLYGRRKLQQLLRRFRCAGRIADRPLSRRAAIRSRKQLRRRPLLHAQQHQPRVFAERCGRYQWDCQRRLDPAEQRSHDRRCAERQVDFVGLLRRRLQRGGQFG